jgi:hypothetical protein
MGVAQVAITPSDVPVARTGTTSMACAAAEARSRIRSYALVREELRSLR